MSSLPDQQEQESLSDRSPSVVEAQLVNDLEAESNVTKMAIVTCTISILHQLVLLLNYFYVLSEGGVTMKSAKSIFVSSYASVMRNVINFFKFYKFSRSFRAEVQTMFKCS
jgi:hypothetical protein